MGDSLTRIRTHGDRTPGTSSERARAMELMHAFCIFYISCGFYILLKH
jgi:hypothetical protein